MKKQAEIYWVYFPLMGGGGNAAPQLTVYASIKLGGDSVPLSFDVTHGCHVVLQDKHGGVSN